MGARQLARCSGVSLGRRLFQRPAHDKARDPPRWNSRCGARLRVETNTRPLRAHLRRAKALEDDRLSLPQRCREGGRIASTAFSPWIFEPMRAPIWPNAACRMVRRAVSAVPVRVPSYAPSHTLPPGAGASSTGHARQSGAGQRWVAPGFPPVPALGMAMRGCRPRQAAARQGRSVRRRSTVQAEATRLYSAGLGASQRALTGASVCGIPGGGFIKTKFLLKHLRRVLASTGAVHRLLWGKSSGYTVVRRTGTRLTVGASFLSGAACANSPWGRLLTLAALA